MQKDPTTCGTLTATTNLNHLDSAYMVLLMGSAAVYCG